MVSCKRLECGIHALSLLNDCTAAGGPGLRAISEGGLSRQRFQDTHGRLELLHAKQRSLHPFFVHGMFPSNIQPPAHRTPPTRINPTANTAHSRAPSITSSPSRRNKSNIKTAGTLSPIKTNSRPTTFIRRYASGFICVLSTCLVTTGVWRGRTQSARVPAARHGLFLFERRSNVEAVEIELVRLPTARL
jgi:hypothetical protein